MRKLYTMGEGKKSDESEEQISRTSGEPKQTALKDRQMLENFEVEATAGAVVEVSFT